MRPLTRVVLVAIAVFGLTAPQAANATHVRTAGATPLRDSLVIAQKGCNPPGNSQHGAPLVLLSCAPPGQTSQWLTAGTMDVNLAPAQLVGFVRLDVTSSDVLIKMNSTDVRCLPATAASVCTPANSIAGPDYIGQLQLLIALRITDHFNAPNNNTPATAQDTQFPVTVQCNSTGTGIGATCTNFTSMNAQIPGSAPPGKRSTFEIPQGVPNGGIQVFDGGQNGVAGDPSATLFLEPGTFLP